MRGRVANPEGYALAGANVGTLRNRATTATDAEGNFALQIVFKADSIIVSHTGYNRVVLPVAQMPVELVLHPVSATMQEVVVSTGYQIIPKERATGSFEQIGTGRLQLQPTPDILSRLNGLSSIAFDEGVNRPPLTIRGLSSINSDKNPLIVVDHFPYTGNIADINPNDVESVTILKDAAAASIWGVRAGNGVIVITTKKAKKTGHFQLSLNSNLSFFDKPNPRLYRQLSSSDFISVEQYLFKNGYRFSDTANAMRPSFTPMYELLFKQRNGALTATQFQQQLDALKSKDVMRDFENLIYRSAFFQQYGLSLGGGTEKLAYHFAGSYDKNRTEVDGKYSRLSFRADNTFSPLKNIQFNTGVTFTQTNTVSGMPGYQELRQGLYPYAQLADEGGNALPLYKYYRQPYIDTFGAGKLLDWKYYPLDEARYNTSKVKRQHLIANIGANIFLTHDLSAQVQYQYEQQDEVGVNLKEAESFFSRDLINKFSRLNRQTGQVTYIVPNGAIKDESTTKLNTHNLRGQFLYNKAWGNHSLNGLVGGELRQLQTNGNSSRVYGFDPATLTFAEVDFANSYPTLIPGSNSFIPDNTGFKEMTNRFVSIYANGAYTYKQRYQLSASARRDASNLFGVVTNDKWTPLWSTGASWHISEEPFWNKELVPLLKLRVTYGISGNADLNRSAVTTLRYFANGRYTNFPSAIINQFPNPQLRWEKIKMFNVGLDFAFAGSRFSGSIDHYRKKGSDLLGAAAVDWTSTGQNQLTYNIANMKGSGWDLVLKGIPVQREFTWQTDFLLSLVKTKVTKYFTSMGAASSYTNDGNKISPLEGHPVYGLVSFKWAGLDPETGSPMGFEGTTVSKNYAAIMAQPYSSLVFSGSATPTCFGNLLNTFSYKNLSITANIQFRFGYFYRKPSINYTQLFQNAIGDIDYTRRWQKPGDEQYTNVPSLVYPIPSGRDQFYSFSEVLVEKADNIRLQLVQLGYDVISHGLKRQGISKLKLFAGMNNIGILWRAGDRTIDPDYPGVLSPVRTTTVGFQLNF
ncbi:membrane protein [Niabella soli DSM 19437]|uniref:Membrane protein n=1 Tax=Niabella soli DSM 19437 TaxID=929713 RepID=W0F6G8_9BACT|nr:membrane protein [Niabella soli DSM 19437]